MKDRSRRSFDKAFKLMVVKLHKSEKSSNEIGRELGIPRDMVWRREHDATGDHSFSDKIQKKGRLLLESLPFL